MMNRKLLELGEKVGDLLTRHGDTIAVSESSTGGLIAATLLSRAGASAYFLGGVVVYTKRARDVLTDISDEDMRGLRSASAPYAQLLARRTLLRFAATLAIAETGATGPAGNSYGDPPGHSCLCVVGRVEAARVLRTGQDDRAANMVTFAVAAMTLLHEALLRQGG